MRKTFLFYDIETSGLNHVFDQILTFACIRTDLDLKEISRESIVVKLRKDIVPAPQAFLTHGLTFEELEMGVSEYDAARKIHKLVNAPGSISIGYNSLGFDDDFLRFTFYRNLLDPYTHQFNNGCYRMDILPVTTIFKIFYPKVLQWPTKDGKSSLKLEFISKENKFITSGKAHEAMSDVEALIQLSKIFYKENKMWEYCLEFFSKTRDEVRINLINEDRKIGNRFFRLCIMVSASFGADSNYMAPVLHVGSSIPYKNQSLWLRLDVLDLLGMEENLDISDTFVVRKRPGDALIVLPALERFMDQFPGPMLQLMNDNIQKLNKNCEKLYEYIDYHQAYKHPPIPDLDPDASLYQDGFFSFREKKDIQMFHQAIFAEEDSIETKIDSSRIRLLANRIMARNFSPTFEKGELEPMLSVNEQTPIIGYKNDFKMSKLDALNEIYAIEKDMLSLNEDSKKMLSWLKGYVKAL